MPLFQDSFPVIKFPCSFPSKYGFSQDSIFIHAVLFPHPLLITTSATIKHYLSLFTGSMGQHQMLTSWAQFLFQDKVYMFAQCPTQAGRARAQPEICVNIVWMTICQVHNHAIAILEVSTSTFKEFESIKYLKIINT